MKTTTPVQKLVSKQVTRQEFLRISGFGLLSVAGLGSVINLLSGKQNSLNKQTKPRSGYSSGVYNK